MILILSNTSTNKTGFVQSEIGFALEVLKTHPPGDVFVIPVKIDDCLTTHRQLRKLHHVELKKDNYESQVERITQSILRTRKKKQRTTDGRTYYWSLSRLTNMAINDEIDIESIKMGLFAFGASRDALFCTTEEFMIRNFGYFKEDDEFQFSKVQHIIQNAVLLAEAEKRIAWRPTQNTLTWKDIQILLLRNNYPELDLTKEEEWECMRWGLRGVLKLKSQITSLNVVP